MNKKLKKLPLNDIKPKGWLLRQLEIQRDGLSGNVPHLFKDLSENSAWLGGNGECWERGPYYLDGIIPLAYLLDDENLKGKALKWIEKIFASQREDGFFGPNKNSDWWPRMVVTKLMTTYYEASLDERVIGFLEKYYSYMLKNIDTQPLYNWANARGIEEFIGIGFLYEKTKNTDLLILAEKIRKQSIDWVKEFSAWEFDKPSLNYIGSLRFNIKKATFYSSDFLRNTFAKKAKSLSPDKINARNGDKFNRFYHLTHGVNIAMALKYPSLIGMIFDNEKLCDTAKYGYEKIMGNHGTANGIFTCDEHLSGFEPTQGTELCTVVETMFSAEKLFEITADSYFADLLELCAYNALPATFTADMCAHQYVQQANQISATIAKRKWYDSYNKANIFGLKPNYACCLSNMHQGFPKFAEHLAFLDGEELVLLAPVAMEIKTKINGNTAGLKLSSDYPFNNTAEINIDEGNFVLKLRKPEFVKSITVNGVKYENEVRLVCNAGDIFKIEYELKFSVKENEDLSISCVYGAILLALNIDYTTKMKNDDRFSDREFFPNSKWNYALKLNALGGTAENDNRITPSIKFNGISDIPFSTFAMEARVPAVEISNWEIKYNQADKVPLKPLASGETTLIKLVPYGAAKLHISQFPKI